MSRMNISSKLLQLRNRHLLLIDLYLVAMTPITAMTLRLDNPERVLQYASALVFYTLLGMGIRFSIFYFMGLYRHYWRFASIDELIQIGLAVLVSSVALALAYLLSVQILPFLLPLDLSPALPRSVAIIDGLLVLVGVLTSRFMIRFADRWVHAAPNGKTKRVGIMGAGHAGVSILREIRQNPLLGLDVICFFDDDAGKQGVQIHGVPVRGGREAITKYTASFELDLIILAMPTASGRTIHEVVDLCREVRLQTKTIPGIFELIDGTVHVNQLRNVELTDLLRRSPVQTNRSAIRNSIRGRRVLVTGGGGSIGRELCRQLLECAPRELVLLGHGENSIFESERDLRQLLLQRKQDDDGDLRIRSVIADIRFAERMQAVMAEIKPDIVFHAAAHKHVPLMELNPAEAITNNVLGTQNVVNAALAAGVQDLVMISTDKAVNPTNIMGASKRAAEMIVLQAARVHQRAYVAVRFGNVLGSRGSVVPIFQKQIADGGPVTVTHPDIRRYFMTIPEAVQLVLQAGVLGRGGEVFVLDMGEPVRIADMAETLIRLSGYEVGRDVDLEYTGLRPGEKLYEELFVEGESYAQTTHEKIFVAGNASALLADQLDEHLAVLAGAARRNDRDAIVRGLQALIPEYEPMVQQVPVSISAPQAETGKSFGFTPLQPVTAK